MASKWPTVHMALEPSARTQAEENPEPPSSLTEQELAMLQTHAARKQQIVEEIEQTKKRLEQLEREKINTQREYGLIYNSGSGVTKLPNEILCSIFRWTQIANSVKDGPVPPIAEVVISHVCSRWRTLALSYPTLWTILHYSDQSPYPKGSVLRFKAMLSRSKQQPLDVWLDFTHDRQNWMKHWDILMTIAPHMDRCRRLSILCDEHPELVRLNWFLSKASPKLEYFSFCPGITPDAGDVRTDDEDRCIINEWVPQVFTNEPHTPSLKYVRLERMSLAMSRPPLDNVVHLRIEQREVRLPGSDLPPIQIMMSWPLFVYTLQLRSLETLSVYGNIIVAESTSQSPIVANRLKHFRCGGTGVDPVADLLPYLTAPKLETLTLRQAFLNADPGEMEEHRFPSLHTLYLLHLFGTHDGWSSLVKLTSKIKHLVVAQFIGNINNPAFSYESKEWLQANPTDRWSKLDVLTQNCPPMLQDLWPSLSLLRIHQKYIDELGEGQVPNERVVAIEDTMDGLFVPEYWPPDMVWMDNQHDPFHIRDYNDDEDAPI